MNVRRQGRHSIHCGADRDLVSMAINKSRNILTFGSRKPETDVYQVIRMRIGLEKINQQRLMTGVRSRNVQK